MAYGAYTGMYTVGRHHHPPPGDMWRSVPGLGQAVPEGGFPEPRHYNDGVPRDPRTNFTYPRGRTRPTPGSSARRRRRSRN